MGKYTLEECLSDARSHNRKSSWQKASPLLVSAANHHGWYQQCTKHMKPAKHGTHRKCTNMGRPTTYTLNQCLSDARRHETKSSWQKASPQLVSAARRQKGWYQRCTEHMKPAKKGTPKKWTKKKCQKSAENHTNVSDWKAHDYAAYTAAKRYGWLKDCTKHFKPLGNQYKRLVYVCRVKKTDLVYVGITVNFQKRISTHLASERFVKIAEEHGSSSIRFFQLTQRIDADEAARLENSLIEKYKLRNFEVLNLKVGGGLGASASKWTYQAVKSDAENHEHLGEWSIKSHAAYTAALKAGWIDRLILEGATKRLKNEDGYWTVERIKQTAMASKSRKQWRTLYRVAYDKAVELGIHNDPEITAHFSSSYKYKDQDEKIKAEVAQYDTYKEFREGSNSLYRSLIKYGRLDEFTGHLKRRRKKKK